MQPHQAHTALGLKRGISCVLGNTLPMEPHPQHLECSWGSSAVLSRNLRLGRKETSKMGLRLPERESSVKTLVEHGRPGKSPRGESVSTGRSVSEVLKATGGQGLLFPAKEWEAPQRTCRQVVIYFTKLVLKKV